MGKETTITDRERRVVPCVQSAGHYGGKAFPRIVVWRGHHWTELGENERARMRVRITRSYDYAPLNRTREEWRAACAVYRHDWGGWAPGSIRGKYRVVVPGGTDYPARGETPEEALADVERTHFEMVEALAL